MVLIKKGDLAMKWLKKFMTGRYGVDQLSMALLVVSIFISILSSFVRVWVIEILNIVVLVIIFYRMFSKNIAKRYQENNKFLSIWNPIKNGVHNKIERIKGLKNYRYFKCSNCKQTLRVPKGKGKISITCPKCKTVMVKKS